MLARLLALALIAVITVATVARSCDFDDNDCDSIRIVAEAQANPGTITDRTTPDRAKADGDAAADPDLPDGPSGAWWVTNPPQPVAPDRLPGVAWYPPRTAPDPVSLAGNPPAHPAKA